MKHALRASALAIAIAIGTAVPAMAQDGDPAAMQDELAAMRAEMARMATRIEALEADLAAAEAEGGQPATPPATGDDGARVTWKGAPSIESESGWSFKPRGRIQIDAGVVDAPDSVAADDGFGNEIRRARLGVEGDIPGGFGYKFELDFAGGETEVVDALLTYGSGGLTITAGQHNNFQGLAELTSSRFISMMERAAFTDAFGFGRRVGLSAQYATGDWLVQGGLFTDNAAELSNRNWSADGRVVFMSRLGDTQLHLGGSAHYADYETGTAVRYRQRPFLHFTDDRFVDTGEFGAAGGLGLGLEAAAVAGPFHAAAEGFWQKNDRIGALADPTFFGGYAEVGMFLTQGDTRGYGEGTFDRVKPANPVGEGGFGAVQVNLRYDYLDLTDAGIVGGTQNGYAVSLVWTPTDYTRFMMNYGRMQYDDAAVPAAGGDRSYGADTFGVRAQIDF